MNEFSEEAHHIIDTLQNADEPMTIDEIVESTHYDQSLVQGTLTRLESENLVEKQYDTID